MASTTTTAAPDSTTTSTTTTAPVTTTTLGRLCDGGPPLQQLALIVRGADTSRHDLAPQCGGLFAISLGLSANFADDHEMLEHGMVIYDALYTWCRNLQAETHGWPPEA